MNKNLNVKLYGTSQPPISLKLVRSGPLSLMLEGGNVRYLKYHGIEIIRCIAFLVRDTAWGTYAAKIQKLKIVGSKNHFTITYCATCAGGEGSFSYWALIEGDAGGDLKFSAQGSSPKNFPTNRVGFVILHPLKGVVGRVMTVEHSDGRVSKLKMPKLISPDQPAFEVRKLMHSPLPGVKVCVEMTGDTFEMEDQRNWSDASFKTYARPLSKPRPFVIPSDSTVAQSVSVKIVGRPVAMGGTRTFSPISVHATLGRVPEFYWAIAAESAEAITSHAEKLNSVRVKNFAVRFDLTTNARCPAEDIVACLTRLNAVARVEVIIPGINPRSELEALAILAGSNRNLFRSVIVVPARDMKTRPSKSLVESEASTSEIAKTARALFPYAIIGGGTLALFAEFNRNPPPVSEIDFVLHSTSSIIHAADDQSVMETLEVLDDISASVRKLAPGKPYHLGPSGIGLRDNPYSTGPAPNPGNIRLTAARHDPRQSGLFAAAWAIGYFAVATRNKLQSISLASPIGDFGVIAKDGRLLPIFHAVRQIAQGANKRRLELEEVPEGIAGFAYSDKGSRIVLMANITPDDRAVRLRDKGEVSILNVENMDKASGNPEFLDIVASRGRTFSLSAYAVAKVVF